MNLMTALFSEPWAQRLGWVLIHFLWQGAVITLLLAVTLRVLARASSHLRYGVIGAALLGCGLMPVATWIVLGTAPSEIVLPAGFVPADNTISNLKTPAQASSSPEINAPLSEPLRKVWPGSLSRMADLALPYVVCLWFAGVLILTVRLMFGWTLLQRLKHSGLPLEDTRCLERFHRVLARMRINLPVRLLQSALIEVPTLIGWLRPTILMPVSVLAGLDPAQLDAVLAHELAHVRRYDYLVNLLQTIIETALFYHPAIWWISRQLREERENCCDDIALEITQDRLVYAGALAQLEQGRALPLALTASGGSLLQRIRRIVATVPNTPNRRWPFLAAVLLALLLISTTSAILLPVWKTHRAPQLFVFINKKAVHFSPQAEAKIIEEIEAAVRAVNSDSNREPEKFKSTFYAFTPKLIEEDGFYFRIVYPQTKTFATLDGPLQAKEIYLTGSPYGYLVGSPDGILLASKDGRLTHAAFGSDTPLLNLTFNVDVYARLPDQVKWQVGRELSGFVNGAKMEDLEPELQLVAAVNKGNLPELKKLLRQGVRLDQVPAAETTLLFAAGSPEMAEFLLDQGVKVDARNKNGDTALISICYNDSGRRKQELVAPTARVLLKHGADPNAHNSSGWTPLIVARDAATVDVLVEYGADVHARFNGQGVLDELDLGYRTLPYYQALAAHGLAIDNHENGVHLLMHAVAGGGNEDIVTWLLERGVDPNRAEPPSGEKPLARAAATAAENAAKILIAHGAKIDDEAINQAIDNDRDKVIKVFWESGAKNISELFYDVSQNAPVEKLEALLKKGSLADPPQDKHTTPLALAARHGNLAAVQLLVEHGANPNKKTAENTPLSSAAWEGHEDVVRYLLQHGARPDPETMNAATSGFYMWTQFYKRRPGNPTADTFYKIIQDLIDAGAYKNLPPDQMAKALLKSKPDGMGDWYDLNMIKILLAAGLSPTARNSEDKTAIDLVQARYTKISDAQTRAHLLELINLFKADAK